MKNAVLMGAFLLTMPSLCLAQENQGSVKPGASPISGSTDQQPIVPNRFITGQEPLTIETLPFPPPRQFGPEFVVPLSGPNFTVQPDKGGRGLDTSNISPLRFTLVERVRTQPGRIRLDFVLVVDFSGSMRNYMRKAIGALLRVTMQPNEDYRCKVIGFNDGRPIVWSGVDDNDRPWQGRSLIGRPRHGRWTNLPSKYAVEHLAAWVESGWRRENKPFGSGLTYPCESLYRALHQQSPSLSVILITDGLALQGRHIKIRGQLQYRSPEQEVRRCQQWRLDNGLPKAQFVVYMIGKGSSNKSDLEAMVNSSADDSWLHLEQRRSLSIPRHVNRRPILIIPPKEGTEETK